MGQFIEVPYYQTAEYRGLEDSTKAAYRVHFEWLRNRYGDRLVLGITPDVVKRIMALKFETPSAANNLRKRMSQLFDLAVSRGWLPNNPARQVKSYPIKSGGHHTWTEEEIARFYAFHKPGSLPHRAVTLLLWTGAARVDAVKLGWFSIKETDQGPRLQYMRQKTIGHKDPILISILIAPDLKVLLDSLPRNAGTFLETQYGKKRSATTLSDDMRDWCDLAGLPLCTPHGLRKALARRLAEAGATATQVMAITGHKTLSEAQRYVVSADREKMADSGIAKLIARSNGEQKVSNFPKKFATNETK